MTDSQPASQPRCHGKYRAYYVARVIKVKVVVVHPWTECCCNCGRKRSFWSWTTTVMQAGKLLSWNNEYYWNVLKLAVYRNYCWIWWKVTFGTSQDSVVAIAEVGLFILYFWCGIKFTSEAVYQDLSTPVAFFRELFQKLKGEVTDIAIVFYSRPVLG